MSSSRPSRASWRPAWRSLPSLTIPMIAELARVPRETVSDWLDAGSMPSFGQGDERRVKRAQFVEFAKSHRMRHAVNFLEGRQRKRIAYFGLRACRVASAVNGRGRPFEFHTFVTPFDLGFDFLRVYPDAVVIDVRDDMGFKLAPFVLVVGRAVQTFGIPLVVIKKSTGQRMPAIVHKAVCRASAVRGKIDGI